MKIKRIITIIIIIIFISITLLGYLGSQSEKQKENEAIQLAKTIKLKPTTPTTLGKGIIIKVNDKTEGYQDFYVQLDNGKRIEFNYNQDNKSYDNDSFDDKLAYAQYDGPIVVGQKIKIIHKNYKVLGKVKEFKELSTNAKEKVFLNVVFDSLNFIYQGGDYFISSHQQTNERSKAEIYRAYNIVNAKDTRDVSPVIEAIN